MDTYTGEPLKENPGKATKRPVPGARQGAVPILRLYGVDEEGHSVLAHVHGFSPYFWMSLPAGFEAGTDEGSLRVALDERVRESARGQKVPTYVLSVETHERTCIMGYQSSPKLYAKVTVALHHLISTSRSILERGFKFGKFNPKEYMTFESNIPYVLRFMIDK